MRCKKVQGLLSDMHNGELAPRAERAVNEHLATCPACQKVSTAYAEMMEMLAEAEPPELPPEFEGSLHMRLAAEGAHAAQAEARSALGWRRALHSGGLVLVGAAAVAAVFWLRGAPERATPGICPDPAATAAADPAAGPGEAVAVAAHDLRVGEVAILTLTVDGATESRDAELEVVLPDGLALVGEDHQLLEEKVVTWTTTLAGDESHIRIPVQAKRPGTWVLVARARVGDEDVTSEARLRVSRA
jgi:hypothetical protein